MSHSYPVLRISDRFGTDYTDLFDDAPFDVEGFMTSMRPGSWRGPRPGETTIVNSPHTPRANEAGPLGTLIVRWIQARVEEPSDLFGWQYSDAYDVHTIAYTDRGEIRFIQIFGRIEGGRRVYDMWDIAHALELQFDLVREER